MTDALCRRPAPWFLSSWALRFRAKWGLAGGKVSQAPVTVIMSSSFREMSNRYAIVYKPTISGSFSGMS